MLLLGAAYTPETLCQADVYVRRRMGPGDTHSDPGGFCGGARMSGILPVPLLFAAAVALWPLTALVRRPTPALCLVAAAFVTALAVIALVWLAWAALWLLEQRW